jgi:tetratricopeptide (TPR) repeat protein
MKVSLKICLVIALLVSVNFGQDLKVIFDRGLANLRDGNYTECVNDFKAFNANRSDVPQSHYNLGLCYANLKRHPEAIRSFREAIRLKKDYYAATIELANQLDDTGSYEEAVGIYQQAIDLQPNTFGAYAELGIAHNRAKKYPAAEKAFLQSIKLNPDHVSSYLGLGNSYYNSKQYAKALPMYQKAALKAPQNSTAQLFLADTYYVLTNFDEAIIAYQKAILADEKNKEAHYGLGITYVALAQIYSRKRPTTKVNISKVADFKRKARNQHEILSGLDQVLADKLLPKL